MRVFTATPSPWSGSRTFFCRGAAIFFLLWCLGAVPALATPGVESVFSLRPPTVDGRMAAGEWDDARSYTVSVVKYGVATGAAKGSRPLRLWVKNDETHLYLACTLDQEAYDGQLTTGNAGGMALDVFSIVFDNDNDGAFEAGEDKKNVFLANGHVVAMDAHYLGRDAGGGAEEDEPQQLEARLAYDGATGGGRYLLEMAMPLASGDPFDIQARPGDTLRWNLLFYDRFSPTLADTSVAALYAPQPEDASGWGELRLASLATSSTPAIRAMSSVIDAPPGDLQVFTSVVNQRDLTAKNLEAIGRHFALVLCAFPFQDKVAQLKAANPATKVLLFTNPYFMFGDVFWQAADQAAVDRALEQYGMVDAGGARLTYQGPVYQGMDFEQQGVPLLDVAASAWQEYFTDQARKYVEASAMDGLFVDTLTEDLPPFVSGGEGRLPKGYTADGWRAAAHAFADRLRAAMTAANRLFIFNGVSRVPGSSGPLPNSAILEKAHGTAIEAFSIYLPLDQNDSFRLAYGTTTVLQDAKQVLDQGKYLLLEAYLEKDTLRDRLYALGCFLLVRNERAFFSLARKEDAGAVIWLPEWSIRLGAPSGAMRQAAGVYRRDFVHGTVLVNISATPHTVRLERPLRRWPATEPAVEVVLQPFDAAILLAAVAGA